VARVSVTQRFSNPFPEPIEAIYTFPLSEHGAVDEMWMRAGERTIRGEIHRREEARALYERARAEGKLAGLLDQERPNVFTQSIANLMPGTAVEVHIEYNEPLPYEDGAFAFSFPTVVGPRFVPGQATRRSGTGWAPDTDRVPDASRITPSVTPEGTRAGHDLSVSVEIDAGVAIHAIDAPLHEIDVTRPEPTVARVELLKRAEIPNRDFVLRYTVAGDDLASGVLAHRNGQGPGYATFVLLPPQRVEAREAAPKEMIFVVDRSGSQSGLPLAKAKETLLWILDHMNPNDTFQVLSFSNQTERLFESPRPASHAMKAKARRHIEGLEAGGGTYMAEAVREVASLPAAGNRLRVVVFMTDGYVGNDFEVLSLVRELRGTSRWFSFGTGNSVNRYLLDEMARLGGGETEVVLLSSPGETVANRFWERIGSPVLVDVRVEFDGLEVVDVYPKDVSDVWAHRPLFVQARYREAGQGRVVLRGFRQGKPYEQALDVELPEQSEEHAALASMWARARVDDLMSRDLAALQSGEFPQGLREEIVEVALAHRLLTQFTSFVAVEETVVNEGGQQRTVTVPVEMPEGVTYEGVFGEQASSGMFSSTGGNVHRYVHVGRLQRGNGGGRTGAVRSEQLRALGYTVPRAPEPVAELKDEAELSEAAEGRLASDLLALVEGRKASPQLDLVDGRVRVRIVVAEGITPERIAALEEAGVHIALQMSTTVVGRIAVEQLSELAELGFVTRIEPA
jgi:Ca-activated chloride channel family protein